MPVGCRGCRHYRWNRRKNRDWCSRVDDGVTNDSLLDRVELVNGSAKSEAMSTTLALI